MRGFLLAVAALLVASPFWVVTIRALAVGAAVLLSGCATASQQRRLDRRVDRIDQQVLCVEAALADSTLSAVDRAEQIDDCRWLYQQEEAK